MKLYMCRTVPVSIIRSFHWTHSNGICHTVLLIACEQYQYVPFWFCSQAVSKPVWHIPLLCVQWKTPDDGQRNCPTHVEIHSRKTNWAISASSWFYYKKFTTMHGHMNVKPCRFCVECPLYLVQKKQNGSVIDINICWCFCPKNINGF